MPECFLDITKRYAWIGVAHYLLTPEDTSAGARQHHPVSMPPQLWTGPPRLKALFWIVMVIAMGLCVAQLA